MEIKASKRFSKELKKTPEFIQNQVRDLLKIIKNAEDKDEIPDIKIMMGFKEYYR